MAAYSFVPMVPNCIRTILLSSHPLDIALCTTANKVFWDIAPGCLDYAVAVPKNNIMLLRWAVDEKFFRRFLSHSGVARQLRDKDERCKFCNRKERELTNALKSYHQFMLESILRNPYRYNSLTVFVIDLRAIGVVNADFVHGRPPDMYGVGRTAAQKKLKQPAAAGGAKVGGLGGPALRSIVQNILRGAGRGRYDDFEDDYERQMARYVAGFGPGYDYDDDDYYAGLYDYDVDGFDEEFDEEFNEDEFDDSEIEYSDDEEDKYVIQLADVRKWGQAAAAIASESGGALQYFAILEHGSCISELDGWIDSSLASFYRNLHIDRLLAVMINLRTLYAPNALNRYGKSFKKPVDAWKALAALPSEHRLAGVGRMSIACCELEQENFKMPVCQSFTGLLEFCCRHAVMEKEVLESTPFPNASKLVSSPKHCSFAAISHMYVKRITDDYLRQKATNNSFLKEYEEEMTTAVAGATYNRNDPLLIEIRPWQSWDKHTNDRLVELLNMLITHQNVEFLRIVLSLDRSARLFGALKILFQIMPLFQRQRSADVYSNRPLNMQIRISVDSVAQLETAFADLKKLHAVDVAPVPNASGRGRSHYYSTKSTTNNNNTLFFGDSEYNFPSIELHYAGSSDTKKEIGETSFLNAVRGWMQDAQDAKRLPTFGQGLRDGDLRDIFYKNIKLITFSILPSDDIAVNRNTELCVNGGYSNFEHKVFGEAFSSVMRESGIADAVNVVGCDDDDDDNGSVSDEQLREQLKRLLPFPKLRAIKDVPKRKTTNSTTFGHTHTCPFHLY